MAVGQTDETENKMEDTIFCNTPPFLLLTSHNNLCFSLVNSLFLTFSFLHRDIF